MRIFDHIVEETPKQEKNRVQYSILFGIIGFLVIVIISIIFASVTNEKSIYNKQEKPMQLVKQVVPDNGYIITQKVQYETSKKTDPDDTSDIFFEVINSGGDKEYIPGTLIKFNHRHLQEVEIEGETYVVIEKNQIQFHIKKEHVKADILKR